MRFRSNGFLAALLAFAVPNENGISLSLGLTWHGWVIKDLFVYDIFGLLEWENVRLNVGISHIEMILII